MRDDASADRSARLLGAHAIAFGDQIFFRSGRYTPNTEPGRELIAHELAHVAHQSQTGRSYPQRSVAGDVLSVHFTQTMAKAMTDDELDQQIHLLRARLQAAPDDTGAAENLQVLEAVLQVRQGTARETTPPGEPAPAPPFSPPQPGPPPMNQSPQPQSRRRLKFFHGTAWSVARRINRIEPLGRGDFGAGFYTHHNPGNDNAARKAAIKWGRRVAKSARPPDAYAGVLTFAVQESDYRDLGAGNRSMDYQLTRLDQQDYRKRQWKWINDIRNIGREWNAEYRPRGSGGEWVHPVRPDPPRTPYNLISGPFYRPVRGTPDVVPEPEDFVPFAVGQQLPQQIVWDNRGIELLNDSSRVTRELHAYDANGKDDQPVTPPADAAAEQISADPAAPPLPEDYL
jgi:hypothetical protein